jgi:Zn-dependent protease with chaperone function
MTTIKILISLFLVNICYAQIYQPIKFPEKVDKKYIFSLLKEKEKYDKKLKGKLPKRYRDMYSYYTVFGKTEKFSNGDIYLSWPAMEDYVNQLLDSILPTNLANKKIHVYVGRNSDINAYCLYDGTMIINAGLLAEVNSEAALVAVMGHELTHFTKNHLLSSFKASLKSKKNGLNRDLDHMDHSQDDELEADNIGFSIVKNSGYDLNEAHANFELFIRENEYYKKRRKSDLVSTDTITVSAKNGKSYKMNTLEKLLSTHPDERVRKEKLNDYIKSNPQTKKVKYKMDEDLFLALQKQARLESINLLFNSNRYQECLERAFIYYLYNPYELTYTYYVAECIRKICLLDYKLKKSGFLAESLVNNGFKEGQSILHDLKFLIPNANNYAKVTAKDLLKSTPVAFESYKEAFYYFTNKLLTNNYQEAYLMRALFENNKTKIQENISKYTASPKAQHKDYAKHYLSNTLAECVNANTKEIVMLPKVSFYKNEVLNNKYAYGKTEIYVAKTEIVGVELANEFANTFNANLQEVNAISLPLAATQNFNTKYNYEKIMNSSMFARRDENEGYEVVHYYKELENEDYTGKLDIFRLDPAIWEFFTENKISTISYATYDRYVSTSNKKLRNLYLILSVPFAGLFLPFAVFTPINYKYLNLYSYNSKLGALYHGYDFQSRKINTKKATKMLERVRTERDEFIKDYNEKY